MDAIRNNFSGRVHLALSGTDYTLCGITHLDKKLHQRCFEGASGEPHDYEELLTGASVKRAIAAADCKRCAAYATEHYL